LVNQLVIQDMTQGVIVIDENGLIRQSNTAAQTFIGPIQSGVTFLKEIAADLQERIDTWKMATDMMTNPYVFDMGADLRVTLHPVSTSRVVGAVIFLEDLVRVKQEARQLKLVALGRLVANIAHEIRNPLGAISHAAELLAEEPGFSDGARRLTAIIGDNALRLNRMVHDIQALNRGESSRRERIHLLTEIKQFIEQFIATEKFNEL
jgi:two-component system sensor histidine kinase PilS (NtrC family)